MGYLDQVEIAYWRNQKLRQWRTEAYERLSMREAQAVGYRNGDALRHHADSAHHGVVRKDCPACCELQAKQDACKK